MVENSTSAIADLKRGLATRNRRLVNESARTLLEQKARLGSQWQPVGSALLWNAEYNLAILAGERMVDDLGRDATSTYFLANMLYMSGRLEKAWEVAQGIPTLGSAIDPVTLLNFQASLLLQLGRTDDARAAAIAAIDRDPRSGQAWLTFAEMAQFQGADGSYVEPLESAYAEGSSIAAESTKLAHACGRCRHQLGNYEDAFEAFQRGADLFLKKTGARPGRRDPLVEQSTSFTADLINEIGARISVPHERVIFVSGLPRSGTTLVEQILASHPAVEHGDELGFFRILAQEIGGIDAASVRRWLDGGNDPNDLVRLYFHLAEERFGLHGRFVDKTVEAGNYMGLLLALFPNAPVFWMRRDPIDSGWSAFRTTFARGASWSWDLADIGYRLAQEDAMADYWSTEAAGRLNLVDYEALVRHPETHIREIAGAAGVQATDQMFRPHTTQRSVGSASVSQVREPINLKGLGVADPYRAWIGPMIEAYERGQ